MYILRTTPGVKRRRGIASLEFAMALPILLLLVVGIVWIAYIVVGQSEVIIQARTKAWSQRFEDKAKRPLVFPKLFSQAPNPAYSANGDYTSETVTKQVKVSPVYDHFATPKASFTVLSGSWDHRALPFDEFPNWAKMAEVSVMGFGGAVEAIIGKLTNLSGNLASLGKQLEGQLLSKLTDILGSIGGGGIGPGGEDSIKSKVGSGQQGSTNSQQARSQEAEKRREELGGKVSGVTLEGVQVVPTREDGPLGRTIKEIERLEGLVNPKPGQQPEQQPGQPPKTPEEEKAQQEEQESNKRLLEMMKNKKKRIEMDIINAEADLPEDFGAPKKG